MALNFEIPNQTVCDRLTVEFDSCQVNYAVLETHWLKNIVIPSVVKLCAQKHRFIVKEKLWLQRGIYVLPDSKEKNDIVLIDLNSLFVFNDHRQMIQRAVFDCILLLLEDFESLVTNHNLKIEFKVLLFD